MDEKFYNIWHLPDFLPFCREVLAAFPIVIFRIWMTRPAKASLTFTPSYERQRCFERELEFVDTGLNGRVGDVKSRRSILLSRTSRNTGFCSSRTTLSPLSPELPVDHEQRPEFAERGKCSTLR